MAAPTPVTGVFRQTGAAFAFSLDTIRAMPGRPFQWGEFIRQTWFLTSVTVVPTAAFSLPFGAVIALLVHDLLQQLGAQSQTGAASVLAIVREAAPIITALLIAGAGGSAICADLGSRRIREEIDAMEVLGVNPIQRLVVPRVFAAMAVAVVLNGFVSFVGVLGGYILNVLVQGGTPGVYVASFATQARLSDLYVGEIKALVFGLNAALVAAYKGLTASGGPKGVADAVNQTVVFSVMLLFFVNYLITTVYLQIVPTEG